MFQVDEQTRWLFGCHCNFSVFTSLLDQTNANCNSDILLLCLFLICCLSSYTF